MKTDSAIFVVATPIGNLDDLSPRAKKVLAEVDLIAAEDTRETRKLLNLIGIGSKEIISYHDHGETERAAQLVRRLTEHSLKLALVSDAGTPCISDPGYRLVSLARQHGVRVYTIPGPSALTALASISGLPTNRILFIGFLPPKAGAMQREMSTWKSMNASVVFYESTRRLARTLGVLQKICPDAMVSVGRELTKLYEESILMPVSAARSWAENHSSLKGEAVVMVDLSTAFDPNAWAASANEEVDDAEFASEMEEFGPLPVSETWSLALVEKKAREGFAHGATLKDLLKDLLVSGMNRGELYQLLLKLKKERS